jgi:hypothetical protein
MADELRVRINQAKEKTTWILVPEGETHTHDPLPGRNGDYQFEVRAVLLTGGDPGPEAVTIDLTVRPYPASDTSPLDHSEVRLLNKKSCAIPNLPWRLKFEYFELNDKGSRAARICVIPGGKR